MVAKIRTVSATSIFNYPDTNGVGIHYLLCYAVIQFFRMLATTGAKGSR